MCCVELALDRLLCTHLGSCKGVVEPRVFPVHHHNGFATLVGPNKGDTGGVCVPLAVSLHYFQGNFRLVQSIFHHLLYFMTFLNKFNSARV